MDQRAASTVNDRLAGDNLFLRTRAAGARRKAPALAVLALAAALFAPHGPLRAALLLSDSPTAEPRIDFRTVVVRPVGPGDRLRVTVFLAFRVRDGGRPPHPLSLLLPAGANPESVVAQAMSLDRFDRTWTHAKDLEAAFHHRARMEQRGTMCLMAGIGLCGGPPAWLLIAPRWPPSGPGLTAVVPERPSLPPAGLPKVRAVRVAPAAAQLRRIAGSLDPETLTALRPFRDGHVIVVDVTPTAESRETWRQPSESGVRVAYEIDVPADQEAFECRMPLLLRAGDAPALTRVYIAAPWDRTAEFSSGVTTTRPDAPQAMVNRAMDAFGASDSFRRNRLRTAAGTLVTSVPAGSGGRTTRAVIVGSHGGSVRLRLQGSHAGAARVTSVAAGTILYSLLWLVPIVLHAVSAWFGIRVYLWLTGFPRPPDLLRRYLLLVVLSPLLTPWFVLKWTCAPPRLPDDGDRSGALGALDVSTFECVARLVVWALLVCVNWVVLSLITGLASRVRFG